MARRAWNRPSRARLRQLRFGRATDDAELRARLAPGGRDHHLTQPGGSWLRFTQIAIAAGVGTGRASRDAIWTATDCFSGSVRLGPLILLGEKLIAPRFARLASHGKYSRNVDRPYVGTNGQAMARE